MAWLAMLLAIPSLAQDTAAAEADTATATSSITDTVADTVSPDAIRQVIEQLQDPAKQQELITQLEVLLASQTQEAGAAAEAAAIDEEEAQITKELQSLGSNVVQSASLAVTDLGEQLSALAGAFAQLPELWAWVTDHVDMADADKRAALIEFGTSLTIILIAGFFLDYVLRRFARRLRDKQILARRDDMLGKSLALITALLQDLVLIAGFAAGCYGAIALIQPADFTQAVALALGYTDCISSLVNIV
ncbi:MAG: hypothetical protein AAF213_04005 [Pseudomonadota bacterium]